MTEEGEFMLCFNVMAFSKYGVENCSIDVDFEGRGYGSED